MADNESVRGSLKGRLPKMKDRGKHKAKIMASREALERGEDVDVDTARPNTAPTQFIEDWNAATLAETGKGGLLSSFKEKVQVMAQRQAQVQIEKELREVNEFRTKVAASVDEKLLDYTVQMQAANRNIATVTAKLHNLSANISEEKITQLLAGIVKPYFEALSGDTSRRLDEMEERGNRTEKERTERFERELKSSMERLNDLESGTRETNKSAEAKMEDIFTMASDATTTTERQLSEVSNKFHEIKQFTESIPKIAKETQDLAESTATRLVQSAETVARRLVQEADDSNRVETLKLNRFRAEEVRKLEISLQSTGENLAQTVKNDLGNMTKTVRSDLSHLTDNLISNATYQVDNIDKTERNLDRSFKNLASEVKQLNEDVTDTIKRTYEAEQTARTTIKDLDSSMKSAKVGIETAESNLLNAKCDMERLKSKFVEDGTIVLENFEKGFRNMKRDSGVFLDDYVDRIESKASKASETVASTFDQMIVRTGDCLDDHVEKIKGTQRDSGVFLDEYMQRFEQSTAKSQKKFIQTQRDSGIFLDEYLLKFGKSTIKAGETLNDYTQKIEQSISEADETLNTFVGRIDQSASKTADNMTEATELCLNSYINKFQGISAQAEESVGSVFDRLAKEAQESVQGHVGKIFEVSSQAQGQISSIFERLAQETGASVECQITTFQGVNSQAEKFTKETLGKLDDRIAKIQEASTDSQSVLESTFANLTKETENSLDGHIEAIHNVTSQAGDAVSAIRQELEALKQDFVHSLDGCAEKISDASVHNAHAADRMSSIALGLENSMKRSGETMENTLSSISQGLEETEKETGEAMNAFIESLEMFKARTEESLTSIFSQELERTKTETGECLDNYLTWIQSASEENTSLIAESFERITHESSHTMNTYVQKIEGISTHTEETFASIMRGLDNAKMETGESVDIYIEKIEGFVPVLSEVFQKSLTGHENMFKTLNNEVITNLQDATESIKADMIHWSEKRDEATQSFGNFVQQFETLATDKHLARQSQLESWEQKKHDELKSVLEQWRLAFDGKMGVAVESFLQRLESHGQTIESVALTTKEEMIERYVTTLQTCNEERETHAKDLRSVNGRLKDLDRILSLIATEMGCSADPFIGTAVSLPDSPAITPGLHVTPSTTIKSRFDEASHGISTLLDFCKDLRSQVENMSNDISGAIGVLPPGKTVSTMLESSVRTVERLSKKIGVPANDSSLWSIMEGIDESGKKNGQAYERFDAVFQETRSFIYNANEALGCVPTALEEISTSATEITESVVTSQALAKESKTLTESLSSNLRTTVQTLSRCKGDFDVMNEAIKKSRDLTEEGKQSADSGNTIVSDLQDILLETSKSVGEIVNTTSAMNESVEVCKATVRGFKTEIEFFKDSVLTTKESIDGSLTLTKIYQDEAKSIGTGFRAATETMKHVTESICKLRDSVSSVGDGMERTTLTVRGTQKTMEDLNGSIGDAEFSIGSFTAGLATFSETVNTAGTSFTDISASVREIRENIKKLSEGIRSPEDLLEDFTTSLANLTEVAKDAEISIADASILIHDKTMELENADIPDAENLEESQPARRTDPAENDLSTPILDPVRPQTPKRPASPIGDELVNDGTEVAVADVEDAEDKVLLVPEGSESHPTGTQPVDTNLPGRPRAGSNKRRKLGNFFNIQQWMSTPATKDNSIPHNASTSSTGLTRKESIVDMLRRDKSAKVFDGGVGVSNGSSDAITPATMSIDQHQSLICVHAQTQCNQSDLRSAEEAGIAEHAPCGDCMDGVSVNVSTVNVSSSSNVHADHVADTVGQSSVNKAKERTGGGRREDEPVHVRAQPFEDLAWQRNEMLSHSSISDEALMLWMHTGLL